MKRCSHFVIIEGSLVVLKMFGHQVYELIVTLDKNSTHNRMIFILTECISEMKQDFEDHHIPFTDDSQTLQRFCAKLEFLLQFGMKREYFCLETYLIILRY